MKGVGCLQSKYPSKLLSAITGALKHWPISSSSVVFTESFPAYGIFLVFKTTPGIWRIKGWRSRTFRNLGKTFPPRSTREVNNVSCYFFHGLSLSEASPSPSSLRLQIPPVSLRASGDACPALVSNISTVFRIHSFFHHNDKYLLSFLPWPELHFWITGDHRAECATDLSLQDVTWEPRGLWEILQCERDWDVPAALETQPNGL